MCGVLGLIGQEGAAGQVALGLAALQHRGQESAGLAWGSGAGLESRRGMGLVDVALAGVGAAGGNVAVGHVRYATAGHASLENAQPIVAGEGAEALAIAHNGHLVNADSLRGELERAGARFTSTTDTEVMLQLARTGAGSVEQRIARALARCEGAYSVVFLAPDRLVAARDPQGFRPLVLGRLRGGWAVASETAALVLAGAEPVREVEPGEVVSIDARGPRTVRTGAAARGGRCLFELVYFARPDSEVFGRGVYGVRRALGRALAVEAPAPADVVVPVPDSGIPGALGYGEALGLPVEPALVRSHFTGRTFLAPDEAARTEGVRRKLGVVREAVRGRRVAVVDDSLVRGTTARELVRLLREAGAKAVHLRLTSPAAAYPCFYGIDTPTRAELLAARQDPDEVAARVGADSIGYLSIGALHHAAGGAADEFCDACFTGDYPVRSAQTERARELVPLGLWRTGPSRSAG